MPLKALVGAQVFTGSAWRDGSAVILRDGRILNYDGDDYMNADHLEFFKDRLLQMQQELLSNANATTSHLQEQEATPDPADRATLEEEYALELRTRDRERKLLLKIQSTLIAAVAAGAFSSILRSRSAVSLVTLTLSLLKSKSISARRFFSTISS